MVCQKDIGLKSQNYLHWNSILPPVYWRWTEENEAKLQEMEKLEVDIRDTCYNIVQPHALLKGLF